MDQTLPNHLDYIVDFEGFSLIFRPMGNATEIVQYRRMTYSKDNLYLATEQILDHLPKAQEDDLFATRLLQSLIKTDQLVTCQGIDVRGTSLYWLIDGDTKEVFDPNTSRRDYQYSLAELAPIYAAGNAPANTRPNSEPSSRLFDLLMKIQKTAQRYEIEEVITPETKDSSTFLKEKWNMDYLYQNGVFGTFK